VPDRAACGAATAAQPKAGSVFAAIPATFQVRLVYDRPLQQQKDEGWTLIEFLSATELDE